MNLICMNERKGILCAHMCTVCQMPKPSAENNTNCEMQIAESILKQHIIRGLGALGLWLITYMGI